MANLNDSIANLEKATSGKDMRTDMINALNALNESVGQSRVNYTPIPVDTVNRICTR